MLDAALGVVAFFLADDGDGLTAEAGKARLDRGILGKFSVTGERREFLEQRLGVIDEMRALRMAGDLRLLPGIELGVNFDDRLTDANLQPKPISSVVSMLSSSVASFFSSMILPSRSEIGFSKSR